MLAEHLTAWLPDQPLPSVVLDHPIQDMPEAELARRAHQLVDGVMALLDPTGEDPRPAAPHDSLALFDQATIAPKPNA